MSTISTVEELRAVIGDAPPGLEAKVDDHLSAFALDFIERCPFLVLSTSDKSGRVDASPKGDAPGFLSVVDEKTLLIPDRPGNRLAYGHLNVIENPQVGLLLVIPNTSETLRINGKAELSADPVMPIDSFLEISRASPRMPSIVAKVTMKGWTLSKEIKVPLSRPTSSPAPRPSRIAIAIGCA